MTPQVLVSLLMSAVGSAAGAFAVEQARVLSVSPSPAFWVAVTLYAASAACFLLVASGRLQLRALALGLCAAAALAHAVDIGWRGTMRVHPAQSVREALGFLAFMLAAGYLLASLRYRLSLAGVVLMPLVLGLLLVARLTPAGEDSLGLTALGRVHISLATIGVATFALASALSVIYLMEDRTLKKKRFDTVSFREKGAPLEALDRTMHRLVWFGFPVFTAALILGLVWGSERGAGWDRPEYPLAFVTWGAFASLLVTRTAYGWRGRRSAWLTLLGFAAALLVLLVYLARRVGS
ncbi:MAG: cytochrome c biogenesis protein CcsA [Myxococcales bacterium]|nr:cytochrome c biogenesis protein CcsA [Myxococcales bacterium]